MEKAVMSTNTGNNKKSKENKGEKRSKGKASSPALSLRGIRQYRSGYIVDVTVGGKRRTKTVATLEEAVALREKLRSAVSNDELNGAASIPTPPTFWTLEQATERTMQVVWAGRPAYKTMCINSKIVLDFFGAATPVERITLDDIDRFVAHLLNERGNSGGTVNRKLSCLSRILRTAFERGKLEKMPKMPKRREAEHRIRFLTPEEEARMLTILEAMAPQDVQDAVLCLLYTGFRCGELWRLECRDINLEHGTLTAWKTKNHHPRTIPIVARIRPVIERRFFACGGMGRLFPTANNDWLRHWWDRMRYHMGMADDPQFVPHMLRHTCATRLSQAGVSMPIIKEWMGHTTITTTARYAHFSPTDLRNAASLLGG